MRNLQVSSPRFFPDYTLDTGSYYNMNRGINIVLKIQNDLASNQVVTTYGAVVKQEW